jgi:hypothetical protein
MKTFPCTHVGYAEARIVKDPTFITQRVYRILVWKSLGNVEDRILENSIKGVASNTQGSF